MIGCSFVVDREYFGLIGLLDPGMEVYGGENIELGMRVGNRRPLLPPSRRFSAHSLCFSRSERCDLSDLGQETVGTSRFQIRTFRSTRSSPPGGGGGVV